MAQAHVGCCGLGCTAPGVARDKCADIYIYNDSDSVPCAVGCFVPGVLVLYICTSRQSNISIHSACKCCKRSFTVQSQWHQLSCVWMPRTEPGLQTLKCNIVDGCPCLGSEEIVVHTHQRRKQEFVTFKTPRQTVSLHLQYLLCTVHTMLNCDVVCYS